MFTNIIKKLQNFNPFNGLITFLIKKVIKLIFKEPDIPLCVDNQQWSFENLIFDENKINDHLKYLPFKFN